MLETEIKKLREAVEALTVELKGSKIVFDVPEETVTEEKPKAEPKAKAKPKPKAKPKADAPEIDFDEIKQITLGLSRSGKKDDVRAKLDEFGVKRLTDLKGDDLAVYAEWARAQ